MKTKYFKFRGGFGLSKSNVDNWELDGIVDIKFNFFILYPNKKEIISDAYSSPPPYFEKIINDMDSFNKIHLSNQKWWEKCAIITNIGSRYIINKGSNPVNNDYLIKLNIFKYIKFMWIQKKFWILKEENIRYIINLFFLILGAYLAWKAIRN